MLTKIVLENFMNIEFAEIEGREGITAFIGGNGQGKSAVFEAVAFVFLDRKKGSTYKDYVRSGERSARVQVEWCIGRKPCLFDYSILKSSGSITRVVQFESIKYFGTEECRKFIREHFDLRVLRDIVFNLQDSNNITQMIPSDRRVIMQKVFNIDFHKGITALESQRESIGKKLQLVAARKQALSEKTYPYVQLEVIEDEDKLPNWKKRAVSIELKLKEVENTTEIEKNIATQSVLLKQFEIKLKKDSKNISAIEISFEKIIENISWQEKEVADHTREETQKTDDLEVLRKKLLLIILKPFGNLEKLEQRLADYRGEISLKQTQIKMHTQGFCDTCGQKCNPKNIIALEKELAVLKKDENIVIERISAVKEKQDTIKELKESIKDKESEIQVLQERITGCKKLLEKNQLEETCIETTLTELRKTQEQTVLQRDITEKVLNGYKKEFAIKQKKIKELESIKIELKELTKDIKAIEDKQIANKERKFINIKLKKQEQIDKQEIKQKTIEIAEFEEQLSVLKQAKTILETILPDFIIAQGCLVLQNFINEFIASTGAPIIVKLVAESSAKRSKGVQFYYNPGPNYEKADVQTLLTINPVDVIEHWLPVSMASGYETALLTLSFKLAIAFMYQSDILLLDEPDKTATEENALNLIRHIVNLQGFKQIFFISHRKVLKDWLKNEADAFVYRVENGVFGEVL